MSNKYAVSAPMTKASQQYQVDGHSERVIATVSDNHLLTDESKNSQFVVRSWERCLNDFGITPEKSHIPNVMEQAQLRLYQDAFADIHEVAQSSVDKLFMLIADIGYTVLLTDRNGITLDCRYDPACESELKSQGLYTGTDWSESSAGTNGIGTSIQEEVSLVINQADHFFPTMLDMTCTVSPIFDGKGKLIASLDATTLHPEPAGQNKLISKLVEQHARQIEALYFSQEYAGHWLLRFSCYRDITDNLTTGILAIDDNGIVVGGNRNAYKQLSKRVGYEIKGSALHEIFDSTFSSLLNDHRKNHEYGSTLHSLSTGIDFFYRLIPPRVTGKANTASQTAARSSAKKRKTESEKMTFERLAGRDTQLQLTVQQARQVINMNLHILVIGETGSGKEAFARAVHNESERKDKPFIAINCAAIPDSLIES